MKTNRRFLLVAIFGFSLAFTFSCYGGNDNDPSNGGTSDSSGVSSSSLSNSGGDNTQSSCPNAVTGDNTVSCGGQTYKTTQIDEQVWMAENLNYNVSGSECYEKKEINCKKYGSLYNWETAGTVCPLGWHLPTYEEWETLIGSLGGEETAGTKLKSANGFAALSGGYGYPSGYFNKLGDGGYWWTATELNAPYADHAWHWYMIWDSEYVDYNDGDKTNLYSVRCVKD